MNYPHIEAIIKAINEPPKPPEPKLCRGCGNEIKGGSRHGFCTVCLGDEW